MNTEFNFHFDVWTRLRRLDEIETIFANLSQSRPNRLNFAQKKVNCSLIKLTHEVSCLSLSQQGLLTDRLVLLESCEWDRLCDCDL